MRSFRDRLTVAGRHVRSATVVGMRIVPAAGAIVLLAAGAAHATRTTAAAGIFPIAPPPAHTGGFGEPTCVACHMEYPLTTGATALELHGLPPDGWTPGEAYTLTVRVRSAGMRRGGFQASARFADGSAKGAQAGSWRTLDDRVATTTARVTYVHHTETGTTPAADSASWRVAWVAPAKAVPVVFHLTAVAADGDGSQFGDRVYALELSAPARR